MKKLILFLLSAECAVAQINLPSNGLYQNPNRPIGQNMGSVLHNPAAIAQGQANSRAYALDQQSKLQMGNWKPLDPYRVFGTNIINARSPGWFQICGNIVDYPTNNCILIKGLFGEPFSFPATASNIQSARPIPNSCFMLITNFPYVISQDAMQIKNGIMAREIGVVYQEIVESRNKTNHATVTVFDYGKIYIPSPELLASQKYQKDKKSFDWLMGDATNGIASAQYGLGVHYLKGAGCETNHELAVEWLTKAANQGSVEASNTLINIATK